MCIRDSLYAVALYLSTDLNMRSAAAEVKKTFGLDGFSHLSLIHI